MMYIVLFFCIVLSSYDNRAFILKVCLKNSVSLSLLNLGLKGHTRFDRHPPYPGMYCNTKYLHIWFRLPLNLCVLGLFAKEGTKTLDRKTRSSLCEQNANFHFWKSFLVIRMKPKRESSNFVFLLSIINVGIASEIKSYIHFHFYLIALCFLFFSFY